MNAPSTTVSDRLRAVRQQGEQLLASIQARLDRCPVEQSGQCLRDFQRDELKPWLARAQVELLPGAAASDDAELTALRYVVGQVKLFDRLDPDQVDSGLVALREAMRRRG